MPHASNNSENSKCLKANEPQATDLPWTGERLVAAAQGDFVAEHLHRYSLALEYSRRRDVLDVACGEGYGSSFLAKVARTVIGVDCDAATVAHAEAKYRSNKLRFKVGRAEKLPLSANSVDLVVSFETLEHLKNHNAMLREIKRVLRPGGRLLISSPNRKPYRKTSGNLNPFHLHELSQQEFHALLSQYFNHVIMGYQRSVSGSWIAPLDSDPVSSAEYAGNFQQVRKLKAGTNAPYMVALASEEPAPALPSSIFNFSQELLVRLKAAEKERESERKAFTALKKQLTERSIWARSVEKELQADKANFEKLSKEHSKRTNWAKSLDAELSEARTAFDNQTKLVEERTIWAKSLERELCTLRPHYDELVHDHPKKIAIIQDLESEVARANAVIAGLESEIGSFKTACSELRTLLSGTSGIDETLLVEETIRRLTELRRDLAIRDTEANQAQASAAEARVEAAAAQIEVKRLTSVVTYAQIHVDHLLSRTRELQRRSHSLELTQSDLEAGIQSREQNIQKAISELEATRERLARYESVWICRLGARLWGSAPSSSIVTTKHSS